MKCIAVVHVDLARSPLGTRSRLADDLLGTPVLRRTLTRTLRADRVASLHVLTRPEHAEAVKAMTAGLSVAVETHPGASPPFQQLVCAGRWWGLDSWRGGVGGLTVFDEDIHPDVCHALVRREKADALLVLPAAAPLIDPRLLDALIVHAEANADSARLAFVQAPPGLAAIVFAADVLDELVPTGQPPGALFTYHPDRPLPDLTGKEACYRPAATLIEASGRLLADTTRSVDRLRELISAGADDWDAERIAGWLNHRRDSFVEPFPAEIEIELTTEDPLPQSRLRPRGHAVPRRGPIRLDVIRHIAELIAPYDDVRIVLGGFGDPCLHPGFADVCRTLRESAAAIAVRTTAAYADDFVNTFETAVFDTPVDVLEVTIDAATPHTYARVQGADAIETVFARIERWMRRREQHAQVRPLIVPSFVKSTENLDDMEDFFDAWQRRLGTALITGFSHYANQLPARAVTSLAPAQRQACRRTFSRAMILADGRLTTCDQDFAARQCVGAVGQTDFAALWAAPQLAAIRNNQFTDLPLCPRCEEWHRP